MKAATILHTIGNTPHIRINRLFGAGHEVWIKSERANPGGSIKDRIALAMVEDAEARGVLKAGGTIIEPTSGNTGIGLAMVAAVKGYRLVLVMPDSMSVERRRLMLAYGASFDLTPREKGMKGAIARAEELLAQTPGAWMPQQFDNPANIAVHARTTAQEILADFADGIDALITGVGTGGHITGCAQVLKAGVAEAEGLRGGAVRLAGDLRRRRGAAPDPGHRRRLRAGQPAHVAARRRDPGRGRGRARDGAPRRARGGHAGRHQFRRHAGGDRAEAAGTAGRQPRARLQLRHRRALPVDRGVPADRRLTPPRRARYCRRRGGGAAPDGEAFHDGTNERIGWPAPAKAQPKPAGSMPAAA
jgi:hypothetical protein